MRPRLLALLLLTGCDPAAQDPADEPPAVPDIAVCDPVADSKLGPGEDALLAEVNSLRAAGGRCGGLAFLPAPPLRADPALRCAARLHAADMQARAYVGQIDPDKVGTGPRLAAVDYVASTFAENDGFTVTAADPDLERAAADIVATWADNPMTCWKLHARELQDLGVGAAPGMFTPKDAEEPVSGLYWTAIFAAP